MDYQGINDSEGAQLNHENKLADGVEDGEDVRGVPRTRKLFSEPQVRAQTDKPNHNRSDAAGFPIICFLGASRNFFGDCSLLALRAYIHGMGSAPCSPRVLSTATQRRFWGNPRHCALSAERERCKYHEISSLAGSLPHGSRRQPRARFRLSRCSCY